MLEPSVHYGRSGQYVEAHITTATPTTESTQTSLGTGNLLCTHDGVLLRKASVEYISDLNTSGSLSLVEYHNPKRHLYLEWRPNESILIADDSQDQGDWALVDTISRRTRTTSECKVFDTKPMTESQPSKLVKTRTIRTNLEDLASLEVKHRGQVIRFLRKSGSDGDKQMHSEYFFQHGNADLFIKSMQQLHIIDHAPAGQRGEEYIILTTEKQKLKKTFEELDIGDIKASTLGNENSISSKVYGFLANLPTPGGRGQMPKARPGCSYEHRSRYRDNYHSSTSTSPSGSSKTSPVDSELENVKEILEEKETLMVKNPLPPRQKIQRGPPLSEAQWREFHTPDGAISDATRIKEIIFRGGIQPDLRSEVWKYLLNYYLWDDSEVERSQRRQQKSKEYYNMKAQWLAMTPKQEANFSGYRDRKCQIEKDVNRTDRSLDFFAGEDNPNLALLQGILMTYVMYNFDLGYVQGMSDLLAPILAEQVVQVDAFWCFVGFMDLLFANFDMDQAGMKTQFGQLQRLLEYANPRLYNYMKAHESDNMYFCFRWLLVWYKREFSNEDVVRLWECLWTGLPCPNFHLFISVAILDQQTDTIIDSQYQFNEILKHINELSGQIDLQNTLETAEAIYLQLKAVEDLPNDIRKIIGEPLLESADADGQENSGDGEYSDDDWEKEGAHELTPEERSRKQEDFEDACERSIFLSFI